jgi:cell division protein YceG involved in septum cleavage
MEISHDLILIIIIGIIILLQIFIFFGNYKKIKDYKKTIQKTKDFEIVEVSVPEEWIKNLEVDDILKDPAAFQNSSSEFHKKIESVSISEFDEHDEENDLSEDNDSNDFLFEEYDEDNKN